MIFMDKKKLEGICKIWIGASLLIAYACMLMAFTASAILNPKRAFDIAVNGMILSLVIAGVYSFIYVYYCRGRGG